jgi:hypothetical protein
MKKTEGKMTDPTEMETSAMGACLSPLGEYVGSIGMGRPLADYSRQEVLTLVEVVVTAYQQHMLIEHERQAARERAFFDDRLTRQQLATQAGGVL